MVAHTKKSNKKVLHQDRNTHRSSKHKTQTPQTLDTDLYVCVTDVINKRKSLLKALKTSLLAQEESEVIYNIRKQKFEKIDLLKKEIERINTEYAKLQKLFPNPKNVISFAEKELNELEHQVENLIETNRINREEMEELEDLEQNLDETDEELYGRQEELKSKLKAAKSDEDSQFVLNTNLSRNYYMPDQEVENLKSKTYTPKNTTKKMSKLDRIQNNLSIIEKKLNGL
ncbi:MAG: hypothetical protein ACLFPL_02580 [Candidatus Nanoarchaeia archaeon]